MKQTVRYDDEAGYIAITNTGPLTYDDLVEQAREVLRLQQEHGVYRCFADDTRFASKTSTMEYYHLPQIYAELGIPRHTRVAVVTSAENPSLGDLQFYENVCRNNGWNVRLFLDADEAKAWLMK